MPPASLEQIVAFFFRPQGRISRREYILGTFFILFVNLALLSLLLTHGTVQTDAGFLFMAMFLGLPLTIAQLVLMAKRGHDFGLPGVFVLLLIVPFVGFGWVVTLFLWPGNKNPNAYGPPPVFSRD